MGLSARKRISLYFVSWNFTLHGLSSYTIRPFPKVSWNSRTRRWTIDLPGPLKWTSKPTRRRTR